MSDDKFKLPGSSYEELTKIIKSYGQFTAPAGLGEVSKLIGMDTTSISRNAGFLVELSILEPGQRKALTSTGRSLAQALEHEMPEEIRTSWRNLVNENEFTTKLISAIKIRNGMDENTLQSHIAYSAGQPKKPQYMTGAKTVVDILKASELIKEKDGKFIIPKNNQIEQHVERQEHSILDHPSETPTSEIRQAPLASITQKNSTTEITININVSVECSIQELDELGSKIKKIIEQASLKEQSKN